MKIKGNNVPRHIIYGYELTEKEKEEFDYIDKENFDCHNFFRYKGSVYDLSEFDTCKKLPNDSPLWLWDAVQSDSYFSGIVIKYCNDYESVIVGRFYC